MAAGREAMDEGKPRWVLWSAVLLIVLPILYVIGYGPACWLDQHFAGPLIVYWPLDWLMIYGPEPISEFLFWYSMIWIR